MPTQIDAREYSPTGSDLPVHVVPTADEGPFLIISAFLCDRAWGASAMEGESLMGRFCDLIEISWSDRAGVRDDYQKVLLILQECA